MVVQTLSLLSYKYITLPVLSWLNQTEIVKKYFVKTLLSKWHKNSFSEVRRKDNSVLLKALNSQRVSWKQVV